MGGLADLLSGGKGARAAEDLLLAVSEASRRPALYEGAARAADTMEGRLEMLTLHACLALIRLEAEPGERALAQRFTDMLFRHIDAGLRESGVGDLSVPRRMRQIAGQFYGRLGAYSGALKTGDGAALADVLARNAGAAALSDYVRAVHAAQAAAPAAALRTAAGWPAAPA